MSHRSHTPLDSDERALAARLAADATASPSPAVDASILAAARAAVAPETGPRPAVADVAPRAASSQRRPHRRWPVGAGVAAALLVAVGVAWQLRPAPDTRPEPWSEDPAPAAARVAPAPAADVPAFAEPGADHSPTFDTTSVQSPAAAPPGGAKTDDGHALTRAAAPAPAQAPTQADSVPAAETARVTAFGADPVPAPPVSARADAAPEAASAPPAAPRSEATLRRAAPLHEAHDAPDHDEPPATADSPQVRAAWLDRVRELLDAGDITAARASLAEFHRRHPDADLPPDLRALLD